MEVGELTDGSSFGELALISNKPRAATIRAKTPWYLAVLGKKDYLKVYGVRVLFKNKNIYSFLPNTGKLTIFIVIFKLNLTQII